MVSVNPTPAAHQGFYSFDPMKGMALQGLNPPPPPPHPPAPPSKAASSTAASGGGGGGGEVGQVQEDPNKKVRKPYTITKSRESWTEQEHDKFLEALQLFDRDWKKIEAFVGSKTVIQIRSHAQKYFLKVQKNGTSEHVPPPRPKRKASHPYPQKAPKIAPGASQIGFQSSSALVEPMYVVRPDTVSVHGNQGTSGALPSWSYSSAPAVSVPPVNRDDARMAAPIQNNSYSSSNESTPKYWQRSQTFAPGDHQKPIRVMPDFAQVYGFIGSVFDPNTSGHLQRLKQMDPINLETALLLMRNLCVNLTSPEFEDHRRLLASYDFNSEKEKSSRPFDFCADNAILST